VVLVVLAGLRLVGQVGQVSDGYLGLYNAQEDQVVSRPERLGYGS
jgi:hypothetical protein